MVFVAERAYRANARSEFIGEKGSIQYYRIFVNPYDA